MSSGRRAARACITVSETLRVEMSGAATAGGAAGAECAWGTWDTEGDVVDAAGATVD